ncbi:MAG TPA: acetyltransferase [Clostridiaceae bacterium]|nr:acetyltransferase [Clostridiaceae bacterium]
MKNKLIIIGASGHGKVVADIALKMNMWQSIVFLDDDISISKCVGLDVIGSTTSAVNYKNEADFFVAIGNNEKRQEIQEAMIAEGMTPIVLIHPSVTLGLNVEIGPGTVLMAGAVINSNSQIGKGCIINTGATIDHDNYIDDYVHMSPGTHTAGTVRVGKMSWLGIGSVVCNNVTICNSCVIGAGGAVVRDILESGTYVGVPVRRIK